MALSDDDIERYARQIVIPGFGAAGQAAVCAAAVLFEGEADGVATARAYARAAGFRAAAGPDDPALRCAVLAGTYGVTDASLEAVARLACPVVWYTIDASRVRAGVRRASEPLPAEIRTFSRSTPSPHVHALAAADAVATAVAVTLGWPHADAPFEVDLA